MDCIIPGHSVRTFSASIACLTKIGKELYVDFDPLDGLSLRTLNDAKSAYGHFRFTPAFFERCSAPPTGIGTARSSLGRSRSTAAATSSAAGRRGRSRSRSRSRNRAGSDSPDNSDGGGANTDDDEDDGRFLCRVSLRTIHSVLRSRKGVSTLRIRSVGVAPLAGATQSQSQNQTQNQSQNRNNTAAGGTQEESTAASRMQLSFEFVTENAKTGGTMKIVHRIGVSDAEGVAAVASRRGCSDIVAPPTVLRRLLDPLKRTTEVALTVDDVGRTVTATSFHHGDAVVVATRGGTGGAAENAVLNAAAASVLKTETSIPLDEFVEYNWRDDRKLVTTSRRVDDEEDDDDNQEEEDGTGGGNPPPSKVNEEVTLVFGIKEAKAMLQFCAQASHDIEMDAIVSFHWGGRPIIIDAEEESGAYRAELILSTLDHKLLGRGVRSTSRASAGSGGSSGGGGSGSRRISGGTT